MELDLDSAFSVLGTLAFPTWSAGASEVTRTQLIVASRSFCVTATAIDPALHYRTGRTFECTVERDRHPCTAIET